MSGDLHVRDLAIRDIPAAVTLLERYRESLESWQPLMWRRAKGASLASRRFLTVMSLMRRGWRLVAEQDGAIVGFALALKRKAPPVYDPGGPTAFLDDLCIAPEVDFEIVGRALVHSLRDEVKRDGFPLLIAVTPVEDRRKSDLFAQCGLSPASEWWTAIL